MTYEVAVKSLTRGTSGHERVKLLREAATMGQFCHPNVLQLYGVVVGSEEVSKECRPQSYSYIESPDSETYPFMLFLT